MAVCLAGVARHAWSVLPVNLAEKQSDGGPQHDNMIIHRPQFSTPDKQLAVGSAMVRNLNLH